MRKRLFEIIEKSSGSDFLSSAYDLAMIVIIILSLIPLAFKQGNLFFSLVNNIVTAVFVIDYLLRFATADMKLKKGAISFLCYPFTVMALIDLLCIMSSFDVFPSSLKILKIFRLLRAFRVFRAAKMLRYSKSIVLIVDVIKEQRKPLIAVCMLAIGYIFISALLIFNIESDSFSSFFDAIYWATVSLTTVGYGDIYPITNAGRVITMISSLFGIAVIALPAGIITAGYMNKLNKNE